MSLQSRAFSTISRVIKAPATATPALSAAVHKRTEKQLNKTMNAQVQSKICDLLQNTKEQDKVKLAASNRFQKYHHPGDTYHPMDLDDTRYKEQQRTLRNSSKINSEDPFDQLGIDPLHQYKNYKLLTRFISETGKILPRDQTGVRAKNQRRLAKAIKRARAMGK
ncbi:ribosomal protein S18-domain-containing protein [Mycotypha africana]|uniref:ribosomal protein S18-domain-containing protein n=1 Tax=Mycotypha africana TaxID=64632 RepID=UPI0023005BC2|nr:ribosomal protein S18-domain-containing protein [Mycotypha africana]KAI8968031.1 ribosomal protein S18-domain-containing protein [Mycotypha africana]